MQIWGRKKVYYKGMKKSRCTLGFQGLHVELVLRLVPQWSWLHAASLGAVQ